MLEHLYRQLVMDHAKKGATIGGLAGNTYNKPIIKTLLAAM